jgi:ribosomal RNA small subunit methyltransferase A
MTGELDLLGETRSVIRSCGFRPIKRLGQNFVVSSSLLERIVQEANLGSTDEVLEIGGGIGTLTARLASQRPKTLTVVEKDRRLADLLKSRFSGQPSIDVVEGDYLHVELVKYDKCISNPPFGISSKMILKLIEEAPRLIVTTLEKDYARRLTAIEGQREYGRLSVLLQLNYVVQELVTYPPSSFFPPPSTKISLLKMVQKPNRVSQEELQALQDITRELFRYRRRKVVKAIKMSNLPRPLLENPAIAKFLTMRVFELSVDDLLVVTDAVISISKRR